MKNEEKVEAYLEKEGNSLTVIECIQLGYGTELRKNVSDLNAFYKFLNSSYRIKGTRQVGKRTKRYRMIKEK